jgi:hypothetical protein
MNLSETRIANARRAFAQAGGVGKVAKKLGYANASFLVQIFGPNPTRAPSEKTMRKIEAALVLPMGSLDWPAASLAAPPAMSWSPEPGISLPAGPAPVRAHINVDQLSRAIQFVKRLETEEQVQLNTERTATLIAMVYEDATEHGGQMRDDKWRPVVQLLRN